MWTKCTVAVGLVLLAGCGPSGPAEAMGSGASGEMAVEVPKVAPSTSMSEVMDGLVDDAAHRIWDLAKAGMAPESDQEWKEVQHAAIQLIAAGSYITYGGTGRMDANWVEQTSWRNYAKDMQDEATSALDAAIREDLNGVLSAGDEMVVTCQACHSEYKPGLPMEGIEHPH